MPYPPCTLCLKQTEYSSTYTKKRKRQQDTMLPTGTPLARKRAWEKSEEVQPHYTGASTRMSDLVVDGICDWCSMLIAGYIESLRQVSE